jgi:hypothetical protein
VPMLHAHLISEEPASAARFAAGRQVDYTAREDKNCA